MKKILCFGDSNTYGYIPQSGKRYLKTERWSGILEKILPDYEIVEEGMNNRTGFFKNPMGLNFSGSEYLPICLENHKNIDICILSLGTNDAQFFYKLDEEIISAGLQQLIDIAKEANSNTKIIIIPPVKITKNILKSNFAVMFDQTSINKIVDTFAIYKETADKNNCYYLDLNEFVMPSEIDGLHYTAESHKIIAQTIANFICQII